MITILEVEDVKHTGGHVRFNESGEQRSGAFNLNSEERSRVVLILPINDGIVLPPART